MEYEDFEIQIGPRTAEGFRVHVSSSPAGEGEGVLVLPADLASLDAARRLDPAAAGGALFKALFLDDDVNHLFHQSLHGIGGADRSRGLRLRLRIHPRTPALHQVPWELLHRPSIGDFLALSRFTPVVRSLDVPRAAVLPPFVPPLKILFVLSQDRLLRLEAELAKLKKVLEKNPGIETGELVDPEDPQALRAELLGGSFHVLHYMGHGSFDPESGEGSLSWGGPDCKSELRGAHLATTLKDAGALRLVVLNACDTAKTPAAAGSNPFAGVATALLQAGIPAVAAMQSPIGDTAAIAFSGSFYGRLALGRPVEEAIAEGRHALFSLRPHEMDWAIPVLFLRAARKGGLFASLAEAARAEPTLSPLPPQKPRNLRRAAAWSLVLLVASLQPATSLYRRELQAEATRIALEPIPRYKPLPFQPKKKPETRKSRSSDPPPPSSRSSRSFSVGSGAGALRFNVSADARMVDAFASSLRRSADLLASYGLAGRSISVTLSPPHLQGSQDGGLSSQVCSLSASIRLPTTGTFSAGPVARSQGNETAACQRAAEALAEVAADQIAQQLLGGNR